MPRIPVKVVSWDEIVEWSWGLARIIKSSGYRPDVIVAIARGGYVPARLLCDFLGVENLISIQSQHWTEAARKGERALIKFEYELDLSGHDVLLVDDIVDTGDSVLLAKRFIEERWKPRNLKVAVLQWISSVAKIKPDYYYLEVKEWVWFQYPWTRLEDVTQFTKRLIEGGLREQGKSLWSFDEVVAGFNEWYGITVGKDLDKRYLEDAISNLVEAGLLRPVEGGLYLYTPKASR